MVIKAQQFGCSANIGLAVALNCLPKEGENDVIASIPIDNEAPVLTLNGNKPMIVKQGDPYVEPGATAVDNIDGRLSVDDIEIFGVVDTSTIGEYTITYTVSDSVGNIATVERTVEVVESFGHWFTGEGAQSDELGVNGDSYVDLLTGDIYKLDPNRWNLVGNLKGDDDGKGSSGKGGKFPKTATSLPTLIVIGALFAVAGGVLFLRRRQAME